MIQEFLSIMPRLSPILIIALVVIMLQAPAQPVMLVVDNTHSSLQFSIPFFKVTEVIGRFERFCGQLYLDEANIPASRIELAIDASSIQTGLKVRDRDLVKDYLECATYPIIYFKSKSIRSPKLRQLIVTGDLDLHGVTKEVNLTLTIIGDIVTGEGSRELGLKMDPVSINRTDYKIMKGSMGSGSVGDTLTATALMRVRDIRVYRKDFDTKHPDGSQKGPLPFSGSYANSSGTTINLITDNSRYFVAYSDADWSWFAEAKAIGPGSFKLLSFSHIVQLTADGVSFFRNDVLLAEMLQRVN